MKKYINANKYEALRDKEFIEIFKRYISLTNKHFKSFINPSSKTYNDLLENASKSLNMETRTATEFKNLENLLLTYSTGYIPLLTMSDYNFSNNVLNKLFEHIINKIQDISNSNSRNKFDINFAIRKSPIIFNRDIFINGFNVLCINYKIIQNDVKLGVDVNKFIENILNTED